MRAIVYKEYGPPDVLHLEEVEKPDPKDDEVLIKVHAVPVNYGDIVARNIGKMPSREFNMPLIFLFPAKVSFGLRRPKRTILGNEFAGEIEALGNEVSKFKVGDRVYGYRGMHMGAYAEYLTMPEDGAVAPKPSNMTYVEAAAIPYGGLMALTILHRKVDIKSGQRVLINGASGGIGSYAVQFAKNSGAEVTGVCSTQRLELVKNLGADKVIDYTNEDFTKNGETYDLIFDVLGKSSFSRCKDSLSENGRYLLASFKMGHILSMLRTKMVGSKKVMIAMGTDKQEDLTQITDLVEGGKLRSVIDRTFPLERTAEAHRYIENGNKKGHVVITVVGTET